MRGLSFGLILATGVGCSPFSGWEDPGPAPDAPKVPAIVAPSTAPKPAPVAPAQSDDIGYANGMAYGQPEVRGSLDADIITDGIREQWHRIRPCVERKGELTVRIVIASDGTVASSQSQASTIPPTDADCVHGVLTTLQYPEPPGGGIVLAIQPLFFDDP